MIVRKTSYWPITLLPRHMAQNKSPPQHPLENSSWNPFRLQILSHTFICLRKYTRIPGPLDQLPLSPEASFTALDDGLITNFRRLFQNFLLLPEVCIVDQVHRPFLHLSGCAMGTHMPPRCIFTCTRDGSSRHSPHVHFTQATSNDVFGIWTPTDHATAADEWTQFKSSFDTFGLLCWDFSSHSQSVVFLDLLISLPDDGIITTDLFDKNLNLHLYLPPASMHPPSTIKGLVIGALFGIDTLCQSPQHRLLHKQMFFKRLYCCGFRPTTILPLL